MLNLDKDMNRTNSQFAHNFIIKKKCDYDIRLKDTTKRNLYRYIFGEN